MYSPNLTCAVHMFWRIRSLEKEEGEEEKEEEEEEKEEVSTCLHTLASCL